MQIFVFLIILLCAGAGFSTFVCGICFNRRKKPGWKVVSVTVIIIPLLVEYFDHGDLLFQPSLWSANKMSAGSLLQSFSIYAGVVGMSAFLVVRWFRRSIMTVGNQ